MGSLVVVQLGFYFENEMHGIAIIHIPDSGH
jgi:hypothetical protein